MAGKRIYKWIVEVRAKEKYIPVLVITTGKNQNNQRKFTA